MAYGYEYLMLAAHSARTLKRHNPQLPTLLITNVPVEPLVVGGESLFDTVVSRRAGTELNRTEKLTVDEHSPFEKTMYLDCDTEVRGDVWPIFMLLDRYDLAVRLLNRVTASAFDVLPGLPAGALGLAEWNSGVLFFRRTEATKAVFRRWREVFVEEGMARDQPALMRAILATPELRLLQLAPVWNAKPTLLHEYHQLEEHPADIRIFHYREPMRRPEVARAIHRSFLDINPKLALAQVETKEGREALVAAENRFRLLYGSYARFLAPLNNALGRRFLRDHHRWVRAALRRWLALRARVMGEAAVSPTRDRRVAGKRFLTERRR